MLFERYMICFAEKESRNESTRYLRNERGLGALPPRVRSKKTIGLGGLLSAVLLLSAMMLI